jgi:hypothetical protein
LAEERGVFSPEDIAALTKAFDAALLALHIERTDPEALAIAKRMIELAKHGERDPTRLRNFVMSEFDARR